MFKNYLFLDLKKSIIAYRFLLTVILTIIIALINLFLSYGPTFELLDAPGTLNLFYTSVIDGFSNLIWYIAPLIALIPYSHSFFEDISSGYIRSISMRVSYKQYTITKTIVTGLNGGFAFLFSYTILFLILFIIDPSASPKIFNFEGDLRELYDSSRLLLCIYFIANSFLFGFAYSIFGMGISALTKNSYMGYAVPILLYFLAPFIAWVVPNKNILITIVKYIPSNSYEIVQRDIWKIYYDFGILILAGLGFIIISIRRWRDGK